MDPAPENNPLPHAQKLKAEMVQLIGHLRDDVGQVAEPKTQALFEASAEVLTGLVKAFDDYQSKNPAARRLTPVTHRVKEAVTHARRRQIRLHR